VIVATAGHVDHGKTSLVRSLTGVDTDRLEEEKRRGMSIELGFAYADLGAVGAPPVGFVDVPGHERFVRNMLAGVAAIDFALLVIAADDGPMPQTREHLAILQLLGVSQGAVALTKIDRVDAARRMEVEHEIAALLVPTALAGAPIFPLVATTGEGVPALRQHLAAVGEAIARRSGAGNFRLAVDRAFSIAGAGVVVTGAVFSGTARVGDSLVVSPQGTAVRLRGIHAQNRPAEMARAGDRCALNLAGAELKLEDLARGDWIVAVRAHAPTRRFDARLQVLEIGRAHV
jgi:selenocysteine-specific elongation factor